MVDYLLNVALRIWAADGALSSAFPTLHQFTFGSVWHFGSNFRPHEARHKPTRIFRYSDRPTVAIAAKFTDSAWLTAIVVPPAIILLRQSGSAMKAPPCKF
jgi:hypothetical protein